MQYSGEKKGEVNPIDTCALAVAVENEEVLGVFHHICEQQSYSPEALFAEIDVVSEEEVDS